MATLAELVEPYIRAAFTGIWIKTREPEEAARELARMCASRENKDWAMASWDVANKLDGDPRTVEAATNLGVNPELAVTVIAKLDSIAKQSRVPFTMLVLDNFHRDEFMKSTMYIQQLQNAIYRGKEVKSDNPDDNYSYYIVVLAPVVNIPIELERLFVVIDHPLPTKDELHRVAADAIEEKYMPSGEDITNVLEAASGLTRYEAEGAFSLSIVKTYDRETKHAFLDPEIIWDIKAKAIRNKKGLELYQGDASFEQMGGVEQFREFTTALLSKRRDNPLLRPRGLMLLGVPGSGKTQAVRCLGNATGRRVVQMRMGSIRSKWQGESDNNLDSALDTVDALEPAILFID